MATKGADRPGTTPKVSLSRSWRRFGKKTDDASHRAKAAPVPTVGQPVEAAAVRRKISWYWVAGAAAILMAAGIGVGVTLPDPKNSKEYAALMSEKDTLQSDRNKIQGRFDTLDASIKGREANMKSREDALATADAAVKTADAAVKTREQAVTAAEKTQASNTIKEGTWTVGVDVQPGTYRAVADVTSSCYWGIYRTGSNGSDIIENDIVSGGRPSVTLSGGQDFTTTRCGSWLKQ
jgi:hypothetical protein